MLEWNLNHFKRTHPHLFKTIIEAMNEASKSNQADVVKFVVCPNCTSENTTIAGGRNWCDDCGNVWR